MMLKPQTLIVVPDERMHAKDKSLRRRRVRSDRLEEDGSERRRLLDSRHNGRRRGETTTTN